MTEDGWHGILDEGEEILWQGRPDTALALTVQSALMVGFAAFFTAFSVFWMALAARAGGGFWMFGLIHFSVGLGMLVYALFGDRFRRSRTWYTLTDRRAIIATDLPLRGRSLDSYPLVPGTMMTFEPGTPGSIVLERRAGMRGTTRPIGFLRIEESDHVYRLMRKVIGGPS